MFIDEQFNSKVSAPLGAEYQSKLLCAPKGASWLVVVVSMDISSLTGLSVDSNSQVEN